MQSMSDSGAAVVNGSARAEAADATTADADADVAAAPAAADSRGDGGPAGRPSISYEQARDELAAVVEKLEAGGTTLEQSLDLWERGERLAKICQEWLDSAQQRIEAVRGSSS